LRLRAPGLDTPGLALLAVAVAWLSTAAAIGLVEPTETRYAEIAREMRAGGDYLIPHLNGLPHFHKPPVAYWATALGFAALGENEWGARVPAALASIVTLALAIPIARRRFGRLGIPSGLVVWTLGTALLFFLLGRSVATDPYLAAAVAGFWALAPSAWALGALGLGFLVKGPVVLVPTVLTVLIAASLGRDRESLRLLGPARGWWLFAAVALPWYLIVAIRTPGLLGYWLTEQLWQRYATHVHQRPGPPWYFVGVLVAGSLPWTAAVIAGLARLWRERGEREARLLLCWLLVPLVFFSFSGSKLPAYLLPCFPAAALIAARGWSRPGAAVRWTTAALLAGVAVAGWTLGPGALGHVVGGRGAEPIALPPSAHLALACIAYSATWMVRARPARGALLVLFGLTALSVALAPYEGPLGSPRPLARVLAENRARGEPIVEFARFNAGVPFYLRETVRLLEVPRETAFEDPARHPAAFVTRDSLASLGAMHPRVWILGPQGASAALALSLGLQYQRVAGGKHETLGFVTR
jgi:4-amino-4-deoxy-L-arabinose transferase